MMRRRRLLCGAASVLASLGGRAATAATHREGGRAVIIRYLRALQRQAYGDAYALLTDRERRYFGTPANFASGFIADRFALANFSIVRLALAANGDSVAIVRERIQFLDHYHAAVGTATVDVALGAVASPDGFRINDPNRPWRAIVPTYEAGSTAANGVRVTIRKIALYTGRLEITLTFANLGAATCTILAYGRTTLRDERGKAYPAIESNDRSLTDRTLFEGLRLAPDAQYSAAMTFETPDRLRARTLRLTVAPILFDGADAPFDVALPAQTIAE